MRQSCPLLTALLLAVLLAAAATHGGGRQMENVASLSARRKTGVVSVESTVFSSIPSSFEEFASGLHVVSQQAPPVGEAVGDAGLYIVSHVDGGSVVEGVRDSTVVDNLPTVNSDSNLFPSSYEEFASTGAFQRRRDVVVDGVADSTGEHGSGPPGKGDGESTVEDPPIGSVNGHDPTVNGHDPSSYEEEEEEEDIGRDRQVGPDVVGRRVGGSRVVQGVSDSSRPPTTPSRAPASPANSLSNFSPMPATLLTLKRGY